MPLGVRRDRVGCRRPILNPSALGLPRAIVLAVLPAFSEVEHVPGADLGPSQRSAGVGSRAGSGVALGVEPAGLTQPEPRERLLVPQDLGAGVPRVAAAHGSLTDVDDVRVGEEARPGPLLSEWIRAHRWQRDDPIGIL